MERSLFWSKFWIRTRLAGLFPSVRRLVGPDTNALRYYSDRVLSAPVEAMADPALQRSSLPSQVIDLSRGAAHREPIWNRDRLPLLGEGLPPGRGWLQLREAIAAHYFQARGVAVDAAEQVLVTHGATGAWTAVLDAFVNKGDKVVLFDPSSPIFSLGARSRQARITWLPTWSDEGRLRFDSQSLKKALRGARLLAVADPGNPTGATLHDEELELIAYLARRTDTLIYWDDTFGSYRLNAGNARLESIRDSANRTLVAGSLSASFGLASARIGWLVAPRGLLHACAVTTSLAAPFVPTICQRVALGALNEALHEPSHLTPDEWERLRRFASDRLMSMNLQPQPASGGYFLWVDVSSTGLTGRELAHQLMQHCQVLVTPGELYSPRGVRHIRVSLALEEGRLREGLSRMAAFLKGDRPVIVPSESETHLPPRRDVWRTTSPTEPGTRADARKPAFSRS